MEADATVRSAASPGSGAAQDPAEVLDRLVEACHDPAVRVWDELDRQMEATVLAAVADVRRRHGELMEEAGIVAEPPSETGQRKAALAAYRRGMTSDVLPALQTVMDGHEPSSMVAGFLARAFAAGVGHSRGLPEAAVVRWGEGALDPHATDSLGRRAGKAWARWFSIARKAQAERSVHVRALALRHLGRQVIPIYDPLAAEAVRSWARWGGRLERACARWADVALPALVTADVVEVPEIDPDMGEAEREEDAGWTAIQTGARALDHALEILGRESPHSEVALRSIELMGRAQGALGSDLRVAESFILKPEAPIIGAAPLPELDRARARLAAWDRQIGARLALHRAILSVMVGGSAVRDRLRVRLESSALEPLRALHVCADDLAGMAVEARRRMQTDAGAGSFEDLRGDGHRVVLEALAALPSPDDIARELESLVGETVDALQAIVRQSPPSLVLHRSDTRDATNLRVASTPEVTFQESARQSLDALRIERIRAAALGFGAAWLPLHESIAELPDVIQFAFDASGKELAGEDRDGGAGERAAVLAAEALERAADVLRHVPQRARSALDTAERLVSTEVAAGGVALLDRVGAGKVQSQFLRAQSRLWNVLVRLDSRFGPAVDRARRGMRLLWLRTGRSVRRSFRRVRALLGDDGGAPAAQSARTVRAFARADSGPGHVPLVYQRLFSLEPVTDSAFLTGRASELSDLTQRWRRWLHEDEVPVIVRGYPGSGVTSFLSIAADTLSGDGAAVVRLDVERRISEESELARRLGELLGVAPAPSLGAFAANLLGAPRASGLADVVIVDGLEHLYLRVPGGTDLLERFLTFMSETEPRIFWVAGVSQPAWKLIAKAEPTAVSQVEDFELRALSVARLKETILQRHRRSGLHLSFAEPREGRALLKRRLRRLRGTEAHQQVLADDFFEKLHRVSMGNLKLALFHWLLAADFERTEGEVLMQPLRRPDFGVLEALDATHNFTLKALLEHRTLTLDEHLAVFRVTRQESYQTFESLQNRRLIERVADPVASDAAASEINQASRYRIRPLLVGAVTAHLRTLNIVH